MYLNLNIVLGRLDDATADTTSRYNRYVDM